MIAVIDGWVTDFDQFPDIESHLHTCLGEAMFTVFEVRHPFLFWVPVGLIAEADMSLTAQRLRFGRPWVNGSPRAPVLETRVLQVEEGESFIIYARKSDGFWRGERVPLDRVVNRWPISRKWRIGE